MGSAHVAEPDEADLRHVLLLPRCSSRLPVAGSAAPAQHAPAAWRHRGNPLFTLIGAQSSATAERPPSAAPACLSRAAAGLLGDCRWRWDCVHEGHRDPAGAAGRGQARLPGIPVPRRHPRRHHRRLQGARGAGLPEGRPQPDARASVAQAWANPTSIKAGDRQELARRLSLAGRPRACGTPATATPTCS